MHHLPAGRGRRWQICTYRCTCGPTGQLEPEILETLKTDAVIWILIGWKVSTSAPPEVVCLAMEARYQRAACDRGSLSKLQHPRDDVLTLAVPIAGGLIPQQAILTSASAISSANARSQTLLESFPCCRSQYRCFESNQPIEIRRSPQQTCRSPHRQVSLVQVTQNWLRAW